MRGRLLGFIEDRPGWPDDPDGQDVLEYIREFAETDWGQQVLDEVEQFGFPGVDSAVDLTWIQSAFLRLAKNERARRRNK